MGPSAAMTQAQAPDTGAQILQEYPGFKNAYPTGVTVMDATPQRLQMDPATIAGRQSEFYFPGDKGGGDTLPNPTDASKATLEIFNQDVAKDPKLRRDLVLGELLHGAKADPTYAKLRQDFANNFDPKVEAFNKRASATPGHDLSANQGETYQQMMERSGIDAYLRGYFMKNTPGESDEWLAKYSPKQKEIAAQIEQYLKTGKLQNARSQLIKGVK